MHAKSYKTNTNPLSKRNMNSTVIATNINIGTNIIQLKINVLVYV